MTALIRGSAPPIFPQGAPWALKSGWLYGHIASGRPSGAFSSDANKIRGGWVDGSRQPGAWAAVRDTAAKRFPWATSVVVTVSVALAYFLAARLSLALLAKPDGVAVFWPAAGLASGALIVAGSAAWWPVIIGVIAATISANLLGDRDVWSSLVFAVANAGEAAIVAGLIKRAYGSPFELNTLGRVIGLFAATIAGTAISGVVGSMGFMWFHRAPSAPTVWTHWFASDALGTLTVAPLVIGLASLIRNVPTARVGAESMLALAVVSGLCAFLVILPNAPGTLELVTIALFPLFVWLAARLPPGITSAATFICAITIVATTTFAIGIFGDSRVLFWPRIQIAQASILAISFGALVLTALFSERRLQGIALLDREARLEEALRAGGVIAFEWDLASDQVLHSQSATLILGTGSGSKDALRGSELLRRIHPDDRSRVMASIRGVDLNKPGRSVTFRYQRGDANDEVWLEVAATTELAPDGSPARIRGLTTDVTERKRSEEEISRARRAAEHADRAKSTFLAAASHDLRQPLQTLSSLHATLERQQPDDERQEIVAAIGRSIDTMSNMLSSLLDINRLETGNLSPSKTDFAVKELFNSVAVDLLEPLKEKGLQWRVVPSDLVVHSDKRMLEEMVRNLISNAIRFTDRGRILLGCRRTGNKIRIEVWDTGIGISEDQLPHIFDEYYGDTQRGGFGLGLAIVRRLGDILDHRVAVRSTLGKGTGFSIEVARGRAHAGMSKAVVMSESAGAVFRGTVLVVEDEVSVRSALTRMLESRGVGVIGVATADEGVTLARQRDFRPELLLCDYNLRGQMNGIESIKSLRTALDCNLPAIIMTADARSQTIEAIASHGMSVLVKPFSGDALTQLINRLLRGSTSRS
jgi:PAS domain S-box-containing protein